MSLLKKGAIKQVPFSQDGFYHRLFLVLKKGGGQRPVLDLSALKTSLSKHFKMENLATLKSLLNKGDYMINLDLTDAYLTVPMHPVPEISSFSVGVQNFSIYRNAIWAKFGPEALHENHEASCGLAAEPKGSVNYLSGRYFDYSVVSRNIEQPQKAGCRLAGVSRISNQLQKVESNSIPADYVLRDAGRFGFNANSYYLQ